MPACHHTLPSTSCTLCTCTAVQQPELRRLHRPPLGCCHKGLRNAKLLRSLVLLQQTCTKVLYLSCHWYCCVGEPTYLVHCMPSCISRPCQTIFPNCAEQVFLSRAEQHFSAADCSSNCREQAQGMSEGGAASSCNQCRTRRSL